MITTFITSLLNFKDLLPNLITQMGVSFYLLLFCLIFIETGVVFMPFLPGDSLLFLCGTFAAISSYHLNIGILILILSVAAVLGDNVNFLIGEKFGKYLLHHPKWQKFFKPEHLKRAEKFFAKYGNFSIFMGRFVPIVRTIVPFTAGLSKMNPRTFKTFNLIGGCSWGSVVLLSGYLFGNVPFVKDHIELILLSIVVISLIPVVITFIKEHNANKKETNKDYEY